MSSHSVKIAVRTLIRNRAYTILNVAGLSLGMAMVIGLFWMLRFEYGFDRYQSNADRLFQVVSRNSAGEESSWVPPGAVRTLQEEIPGVDKAASVYRWDPEVLRADGRNLKQENFFFAPPDFLRMVDVQWVQGSPETSLSGPNQVVLDEPTATKMFHGDAMGKVIRFENKFDLTVTGIIHKVPVNSEFELQMVASYETLRLFQPWITKGDYWGGGDTFDHGYVLLKPGADPGRVASLLSRLTLPHKDRTDYTRYALTPLTQIHFDRENDAFNYSFPRWLLVALGLVGIFLALIASFNFINMATVQAVQRSKEMGMRKILGSSKGQIAGQFFVETALIVGAAVGIGALLANVAMPYAGTLINTKAATFSHWGLDTLIFLVGLVGIITLIAGSYPAWILSGFRPLQMLQARLYTPSSNTGQVRKVLVIAQFTIAQVLVICTLVGIRQIKYFYHTDVGFARSGIVAVNMPDRGNGLLRERLRHDFLEHPEIEAVTFGVTAPSSTGNVWSRTVHYPDLPKGSETFRLQYTDTNYFGFFNIPLLSGRVFTQHDTSGQVIINETAARDMGFKNTVAALGARFKLDYIDEPATVIGVVKDFHSQSLKEAVEPHVFYYGNWNFQTAALRLRPGQEAAALTHIAADWKQVFPNDYFTFHFLSNDLEGFYADEAKLSRLLSVFAAVAICIGCAGLFGLVAFVCAQKTKEIGIRKVLGAGIPQILSLLTIDFIQLVLWAFIIAAPVGWYLTHVFLQNYANRISVSPWLFALTGLVSLGVAILTVSYHAIKASIARPVASLRGE
jgi:putative ABC transport system permease protein